MEYWFIINGQQVGPCTLQQVWSLPVAPYTPAWHQGIAEWTVANQIPEIADLLQRKMTGMPAPWQEPQPLSQPQSEVTGEFSTTWTQPAPEPQSAPEPVITRQPMPEGMPSTYLVWSILSTVLCCLPFGIAAIIFSVRTRKAALEGDKVKAEKNSELAQWMIILSIVLGLVLMPIQGAIQSMSM